MNKEQIQRNQLLDACIQSHWEKEKMLRKQISEAIYDMLQEMGGKIEIDWSDDDDYPCIAYDGGNHVEYASTLSSSVECIKAVLDKDAKTFSVDCEDTIDYNEERMLFEDVIQVYEYVCMKYGEPDNEE